MIRQQVISAKIRLIVDSIGLRSGRDRSGRDRGVYQTIGDSAASPQTTGLSIRIESHDDQVRPDHCQTRLFMIYATDDKGKIDPTFTPIIDGSLGSCDQLLRLLLS